MLGERPGPRAGLKAREASFAGALSCIVVVRYNRDARRSRPPLDVFGKKRRFLCVMGAYRPLRRFACLGEGDALLRGRFEIIGVERTSTLLVGFVALASIASTAYDQITTTLIRFPMSGPIESDGETRRPRPRSVTSST